GSGGNCTLVETEKTAILLDAGMSCRQIMERLAVVGRPLQSIQAILLSHEHADHISALSVLCKHHPVPVYANRFTAEAVASHSPVRIQWRLFETGRSFEIGDITVQSFSVPHDAQDPVGFVMHNGNAAAGFATDLGHATRLVAERLRTLDALVLESNHDVVMLQNNPHRPWSTKQRILSRHGHLSNEDAARLAAEIATERLRHLLLVHLSRDCNTPELAHRAVSQRLRAIGATHVRVALASQDKPADPIRL
ncbi:MAG: MBL fold metallo-hydrolase, partial [Verrucomicrobiae bacterium]|nr:MBL fold metallo-hydrolase [Verrucomicrobiae bacterium]